MVLIIYCCVDTNNLLPLLVLVRNVEYNIRGIIVGSLDIIASVGLALELNGREHNLSTITKFKQEVKRLLDAVSVSKDLDNGSW